MPQPDVFFEITRFGREKMRGQLRFPALKEEKPTLMVGSLGWSPVRSSVGGETELTALLGLVIGEALGQLGQREPIGFLAVDQGFHDVGGQGRQLEDAGHIRAIDVEGTGKLADGLDLARFEDVGPGKGPCQRLAEWLADHRREYAAFVLEGTRPLGKNFGGKEDPAPCADK